MRPQSNSTHPVSICDNKWCVMDVLRMHVVGLSFYKSIFANYLNFFHDNLITRFPSEDPDDSDEADDDSVGLTSGATSRIDTGTAEDSEEVVDGCNCSSINSAALAPVALVGLVGGIIIMDCIGCGTIIMGCIGCGIIIMGCICCCCIICCGCGNIIVGCCCICNGDDGV